jgi:hypothetical protein
MSVLWPARNGRRIAVGQCTIESADGAIALRRDMAACRIRLPLFEWKGAKELLG